MEPFDRLFERVAADEPHRVVGAAVGVRSQAVDRDDAGMLEAAGDLGLEDKPAAADGVVGVRVEDLLERHLAVQLAVECHEDGPRPPWAWGRKTWKRCPSRCRGAGGRAARLRSP